MWVYYVCTYHRYQDGQTFSILYSNGKYVEGRGGDMATSKSDSSRAADVLKIG